MKKIGTIVGKVRKKNYKKETQKTVFDEFGRTRQNVTEALTQIRPEMWEELK